MRRTEFGTPRVLGVVMSSDALSAAVSAVVGQIPGATMTGIYVADSEVTKHEPDEPE